MTNCYNQNDYDLFLQKDDKVLPGTDHTEGNVYSKFMHDDQNSDLQFDGDCIFFSSKQKEEQDIEDQFQILPLSQDDLVQMNKNQQEKIQQQVIIQQIQTKTIEKIQKLQKKQDVPETMQIIQNSQQLTLDYKLSKKWKNKMQHLMSQKKFDQFSDKHNRNMAKFFIRLCSKYIKSPLIDQRISSRMQQQIQQVSSKKCISLKDLEQVFGGQDSRCSREFLSKILRSRLKQQIIKSHDVKNKSAYLMCSKVYALRCRSSHLIGRLQSK